MTPLTNVLTFLFLFVFALTWLCRAAMKPITRSFDSGFSLPDSINRISMVCMTFNSTTLGMQWIYGSVKASKVVLECRTRGVKRSFTQFNGVFTTEGDTVSLKGTFGMSDGARISIVLWMTLLVPGFVVLARRLIVDYNQGLMMLFVFVCAMLGFMLWVMKMRISDYPDEVKFISTSIEDMLRHEL